MTNPLISIWICPIQSEVQMIITLRKTYKIGINVKYIFNTRISKYNSHFLSTTFCCRSWEKMKPEIGDDADVLVMLVLHFKHEVFGVQILAEATWSSKEKGECISITSIKVILSEDCVKYTSCKFGQVNMLTRLQSPICYKSKFNDMSAMRKKNMEEARGINIFRIIHGKKPEWSLNSSKHYKFIVATVSSNLILHPETTD